MVCLHYFYKIPFSMCMNAEANDMNNMPVNIVAQTSRDLLQVYSEWL